MNAGDEEFVPEEEAEEGPAALKKLREKLRKAVEEKQEYLDGWQRARADFANAKKQFEEEKGALKSLAGSLAAEALLPALESLNRAREQGELPPDFAGVAKQLEEGFKKLGVEKILPAVGDEFDPREHEALHQDDVQDANEDGKITKVLEAGWKMENRVIRPAKVAVGIHQ